MQLLFDEDATSDKFLFFFKIVNNKLLKFLKPNNNKNPEINAKNKI